MVPTLSMVFMCVTIAVSMGLPIILYFVLRKRYALNFAPALVGAAAFIAFAMILEQILHSLVLRPDADGNIALLKTPALYVLYGIFAAGVFEETGRFLSFKLLRKSSSGIGTGIAYGIGHGGAESIIIAGFSMINNLLSSMMLNYSTSLDPALASQLSVIADVEPVLFLVSGFERICAVAIQISLSVIVWHSVDRNDKVWLFPAAIILHALIDVPAALMQVGVIKSIFAAESLIALCAIMTVALTIIVSKRFGLDDDRTVK